MNRLEMLIKEYASADETGRLHMFLAHRELRDSFIRVDLEELAVAKKNRRVASVRRWMNRLCLNLKIRDTCFGRLPDGPSS